MSFHMAEYGDTQGKMGVIGPVQLHLSGHCKVSAGDKARNHHRDQEEPPRSPLHAKGINQRSRNCDQR